MKKRLSKYKSHIKTQATMDNLQELVRFVSDCAVHCGFSEKRIKKIELATEEALVNIINYAYEENTGDVEIICSLDTNKQFIIDIVDSGVPFDAFSIDDPDVTSDLLERPIGGLGIFLIKQLMDNVAYYRKDGKNMLTLVMGKKEDS